jgi:hypothetical protein
MGTVRTTLGLVAAAALAAGVAGTPPALAHGGHDGHGGGHGHHGSLETVVDGLQGPRGVDALGHGLTLVTETDGTFSLVVEGHRDYDRYGVRGHHHGSTPTVIRLGQVPADFAPAIAAGPHRTIWILTGGTAPDSPTAAGSATLYRWRPGMDAPEAFKDIAAYQATDPDPYDLDQPANPTESNPFGLAALRDGSVLVADAAGNDLLRVMPNGDTVTVARLKPRVVEIPEGLPGAGTTMPSEDVATSVTVGRDGYWYIGELRGYPATAGTSEIWRVRPGTTDALCDPEHPWGACSRYADGLTSIMDLGAGPRGIYAVTLSKMTWLAAESDPPVEGAEIGGLFLVSRHSHHHGHYWRHHHGGHVRITELVPNQLTLPGGVDVVGDTPYVVGPVFGPGALSKID